MSREHRCIQTLLASRNGDRQARRDVVDRGEDLSVGVEQPFLSSRHNKHPRVSECQLLRLASRKLYGRADQQLSFALDCLVQV
jgi:hypothetical protein